MAWKWLDQDLTGKVKDIISKAQAYHEKYYESETFSGPSLYFHCRAISAQKQNWVESIELIYAVLASWGMHRMGAKGSKMRRFDDFEDSVISVRTDIDALRQREPEELSLSDWDAIERVFKRIKAMASGTTIVGNSKVMAHILPKLIAPVDREYTLNYLFGNKMFQNGLEREWRLMRKILSEFYYPVANDREFQDKAEGWMTDKASFPWDTSILKIIDNLVIGAVRRTNDAG